MNGGPVGLLLSYLFIGSICFATMVSSCVYELQDQFVLSSIIALSLRDDGFPAPPWRLHQAR